jgi:hypothetical protein
MSFKGDVKPVVCQNNSATAVLWTGPTRLRGIIAQSVGTSGTAIINGLADATTVSSSTNTQVYMLISVGANQSVTLNLPEDGINYAAKAAVGVVDGIGVINNSGINVTLLIDK